MELLKKAAEYFLMGLFFLGLIIIYGTLKASHVNLYVLGVGVVLVIISVGAFILYLREESKGEDIPGPENLKFTGQRIPVDLTKCTIVSNNWTEEVERYDSSRVVLLNEISGHGDKNVERVNTSVSRIKYSTKVNGVRRNFISQSIPKDKTTLMMLMEMQQTTNVYIDASNPRYYYFDVEFIDA